MTEKEFAKYMVDNMHRATLANALNIVNNLSGENPKYNIDILLAEIDSYVSTALSNKKIDKDKAYKILYLSSDLNTKLHSDKKYQKIMLLDDFIIRFWNCFQWGVMYGNKRVKESCPFK